MAAQKPRGMAITGDGIGKWTRNGLQFSSDVCDCGHVRASHWSIVTLFRCRECRCSSFWCPK